MSAVRSRLAPPALLEAGAGETTVALSGSCAVAADAVLHREGDAWLLRGLAVGGLFRLVLEVDDAVAADRPGPVDALRGALPRGGHPQRAAGVGLDHESVLLLMRRTLTEGANSWTSDCRVGGLTYCELDLRATADVDPDNAVLLATHAKALLGRWHDSRLMNRLRHERPLAYAVHDTALDGDGRIELRMRIGGDPATCDQRVAVAMATATESASPIEHAAALRLMQARLATEALGGGQQGAVALDLADRLRHVLVVRGVDAACVDLASTWGRLSWTVEHEHEHQHGDKGRDEGRD